MKWIKYLRDFRGKKAGEIVEVESTLADTLVETGAAEIAQAPAGLDAAAKKAADFVAASNAALIASTAEIVTAKVLEAITPAKGADRRPGVNKKDPDEEDLTVKTVPATVKRYSSLRSFKGQDADLRAYQMGMWFLACAGQKATQEWCIKRGLMLQEFNNIVVKVSRENINTSAGFLVPDEFQNDLIDLREQYGIFRQNAKIVPMSGDTRSDPRRVNGLTAYFEGESQSPSLSDKSWDRVRLTAKKLMVLSKYSNELREDAVLNIADDLATEIAYAFALKEDQCGFIGDGTSTYGGIVGVAPALKNVSATIANIMGLTVASGTGYATSYGSIVLADFNKVVGALPEYADPEAKWYVSKFFWGSVMQKLATAAGGNKVMDIENGARVKSFLGYPVIVSQVMPKTPAVSQVCALFGDLRKAARLGDRRQTTIQMSDSALNAFEQDEIVVRGTERFDIVVHDVGDDSTAAKSAQAGAVAGPMVGLITAAS